MTNRKGGSFAGIRVGGGASAPISSVGLCSNFQAQSVIDCGKPLSAPAIVDVAVLSSACKAQKSVMQQLGKCGVALRAPVPRRSFDVLAEGESSRRRMELLCPASGVVANDCNRSRTPTELDANRIR